MQKRNEEQGIFAEFKIMVVEEMQKKQLGLFETIERFELATNPHNAKHMLRRWERIYLEEGATGLMKERRGRSSKLDGVKKGRPSKLEPQVEEDLIAEVQRLKMENEFKKTRCLGSSGRAKERQKTEIVSDLRRKFPLQALLVLSHLPRSTYYYYLKQQVNDKYGTIKQAIKSIFVENKQRYGYRRIVLALRQKAIVMNYKTCIN